MVCPQHNHQHKFDICVGGGDDVRPWNAILITKLFDHRQRLEAGKMPMMLVVRWSSLHVEPHYDHTLWLVVQSRHLGQTIQIGRIGRPLLHVDVWTSLIHNDFNSNSYIKRYM